MSRTEYRVWDKAAEKMFYFDLKSIQGHGSGAVFDYKTNTDIYLPGESIFESSSCSVMQYTGFDDRKGVRAYESDLYRPWEDDRVYQVIWDETNAAFKLQQVSGKEWPCPMMQIPYSDGGIIGNIHQDSNYTKELANG